MKKVVIFLLTLCVVTPGVLETSAVLFKNNSYAETKSASDKVAQDSEKGARTDVSNPDLKELTGKDVKDGTYDIEVESDSAMFKIIKAKLTVKDGKMSAVLTLSGKGTSFSKRKQKWYDHQIVFLADTLPEGAVKKDHTVVIVCVAAAVVLGLGAIFAIGRSRKKKSAK